MDRSRDARSTAHRRHPARAALDVLTLVALVMVFLTAGGRITEQPAARTAAARTVPNVPSGFTAADLRFSDHFGGPRYRLLRNWNFGIASKRSTTSCDRWIDGRCWSWGSWISNGRLHYEPWWMSGLAPYQTSYIRQDTGNITDAECFVPRQVSQTSGGGTYRSFAPDGRGLRITARKGTNPACFGKTWQSGAVNTMGKQSVGGRDKAYYVEVRARLPHAYDDGRRITNGSWVGFWMLPALTAADDVPGDKPELDLFESGYRRAGTNPLSVVTNNVQYRTADGTTRESFRNAAVGADLSASYHTYAARVNTRDGTVRFYVDGQQIGTTQHNAPTVPMSLLITFQVAGADNDFIYQPQTNHSMSLDVARVRVFQRSLG